MENETESLIMKFCRDACHGKRVVGMRNGVTGFCIVRYLDTMGPSFVDGKADPKVTLFYGESWANVLDQILASGWQPK